MLILNGETVKTTIFPDKTSQVWKVKNIREDINLITFVWESDESEIFHLVQLVHLIDTLHPGSYKKLYAPFLPFSRQDKQISNETTFALYSFANILNSLNINLITSFDAHSKVAQQLINRFESIKPDEFHNWAYRTFKANLVFYPDAGAAERYSRFGETELMLYGEKVRNQLTGEIEGYKLVNENLFSVKNKRVLIVDDLCDGGATFIHAAKALYRAGADEVGLCVSHGVFSKGFQPLLDAGIRDFYTTNSLLKNESVGYKVYE